jgi:hypothetical protein
MTFYDFIMVGGRYMETLSNNAISISFRAKKKTHHFLPILIIISFLIASIAIADEPITVQGIGYPPIRVQNSAQARLMAKRAAILDGYRNALKKDLKTQDDEGKDYYLNLSGFVRGSEVIKEEYLSDGSVRVTLRVFSKDLIKVAKEVKKEPPLEKGRVESEKTQSISIEEWYKVIQGMVRYH